MRIVFFLFGMEDTPLGHRKVNPGVRLGAPLTGIFISAHRSTTILRHLRLVVFKLAPKI